MSETPGTPQPPYRNGGLPGLEPVQQRMFPLADILSITTERLLSRRHMDGIYDILGYMTGDTLFTHQLPRAADTCKPVLLEQHPQLAGIAPPDGLDAPDLMAWLAHTEQEHGGNLPVRPVTDWGHQNPIEELCDMVGPEKVYVIPASADPEQ